MPGHPGLEGCASVQPVVSVLGIVHDPGLSQNTSLTATCPQDRLAQGQCCRLESHGIDAPRRQHYGGVSHDEAPTRRVENVPDSREQLRELLRWYLTVAAECRHLLQPLVSRVASLPVELPLLRLAEPPGLPDAIDGLVEQRRVGRRRARSRVAFRFAPERLRDLSGVVCRPPATWDHLEVSFASSMGPPFRQ